MPRTPLLEHKSSLRVLGAAFVALMLFFVWLTYAFFNKQFIDTVPVTLHAPNAGLQLPDNADVKINGMIVGEVREVSLEDSGKGVVMRLAMDPDDIDLIPANVSARIIPKTLFGQKYVSLVPPKHPSQDSLSAGDVIEKAIVPVETADLLNNLYTLLEAVQPAELSYTLSAIAQALDGRGEELGETLVTLDKYLVQINPDVPALVDDLVKLGTVADGFADAIPDLGRLLTNLVVTGDTIVAKQAQLRAFFKEGTKLADTTSTFLKVNGDNIITLADQGQPLLEVLAHYSPTIPCTLAGINNLIPKLNNAFRDHTLHINLELLPLDDTPTGYRPDEQAVMPLPSKVAEVEKELNLPSCFELPNQPYDQGGQPDGVPGNDPDNPYDYGRGPIPPFDIYQLTGIKCDHKKFNPLGGATSKAKTACGGAAGLPRPAAGDQALIDMVQPSVGHSDHGAEREYINTLIGASLGIPKTEMPGLATIMFKPILDGSGVRVSEAR